MILEEAGYQQQAHDLMVDIVRLRCHSISRIIRGLAWGYYRLYHLGNVGEINHGMCDDFAHDVCSLVPGAKAVWGVEIDEWMPGSDGHCVVLYNGRYYDAECSQGVDRIHDITYFVECAVILEDME